MRITTEMTEEIKQIYNDITEGPEAPLRDQLTNLAMECESGIIKGFEPYTSRVAKTDSGLAEEITDALSGVMLNSEQNGFIMGFIYARALFG